MKPKVERELLSRWIAGIRTGVLRRIISMIELNSRQLIRGAFTSLDGSQGCLAHWFGLAHPKTRNAEHPGPSWLIGIGIPVRSRVVHEWDRNPRFRKQLLRALKLELYYEAVMDNKLTLDLATEWPWILWALAMPAILVGFAVAAIMGKAEQPQPQPKPQPPQPDPWPPPKLKGPKRKATRFPKAEPPRKKTLRATYLQGPRSQVRKRVHFDQCCKPTKAVRLRLHGFIVTTTSEAGLTDATDLQQLAYCCRERALLVTHDNDFLALHAEGVPHAGILHLPVGDKWDQEMLRVCLRT